jgi:hypothetical protein
MKFAGGAVILSALAATSTAFVPATRSFQPRSSLAKKSSESPTALDYSVGIVGATGAVGKEIRNCLEDRGLLAVDQLRIFGSSRSAGSKVDTKYGEIEVELFDVDKSRECDVVFLAVDGDFALEHARKISEGDDGAVVIDNSVRTGMRIHSIYYSSQSQRRLIEEKYDCNSTTRRPSRPPL